MSLPPYHQFPIIKSEIVTLKQVEEIDIPALLEISFYDGKAAENLSEATQMQHTIDLDYQNGNSIHWCIVESNSNQIAGTIGYYRGFTDNQGELGCILKLSFRGKGLMNEALKLAANFGIEVMQLKRVIAITTQDNQAAINLLNRNNFKFIKKREIDFVEFIYENNKK